MDFDLTHGFVRLILALIFVLGLILLLAAAYKKWAAGKVGTVGRGRDKRIAILEVVTLDPSRRVILLRRDGVEHLVLVGGGNDVVIESGIGSPSPKPRIPSRDDGLDDFSQRREPTLGANK